jgi:HlyD family secretion protein
MAGPPPKRLTWNTKRPLLLGLGSFVLLVGIIGVWSVRANIAGAVIGLGAIEVSSAQTAVQHPVGGVVKEILALEGDSVRAGDVVVRLDDWQLLSDLKVVEADLFETLANIARLEAEIEGRTTLQLHPALAEVATRPEVAQLIRRQQRQLDAYFAAIQVQDRLLDEQAAQIDAQIVGVKAQLQAKADERALAEKELVLARDLNAQGLNRNIDLLTLETADVTRRGEIGRLSAQIAELRGKISETDLKRHALRPDAEDRAAQDLAKLRPERTRFLERRASLLDDLTKLDIRAPVSGKIYQSRVQGLRSVVVAASPLMMIVPDHEPVLVNVRVFSTDIDQAYVGQPASLKFKAFNGRQIPVILGRVLQISADATLDARTQKTFYEVKVALLAEEMVKLGDKDLIPGMPVEAFLSTETRTPLSYVLRPFMFYFDRAFRDS